MQMNDNNKTIEIKEYIHEDGIVNNEVSIVEDIKKNTKVNAKKKNNKKAEDSQEEGTKD